MLQVRLKCVRNPGGSQSSVSLFLLEPKTCEYILGVESPMICDIIKKADIDYGLIDDNNAFNVGPTEMSNQQETETIANEDEWRTDIVEQVTIWNVYTYPSY